MAVDMFLKIEGIKGESSDDKHKGEIEVLSWSWGASQTGTMHHGMGGGAGKANIQDITVTKYIDRSTALLLQQCVKGAHFKEALLTVRKAGGKPLEYIKVKMTDALITSVSVGGSGGEDRLTENVAINFAKVNFDYVPQKPDGSGDAQVQFGWDIAKNKPA
jgi:type VI secretion system secreted protein Hcp